SGRLTAARRRPSRMRTGSRRLSWGVVWKASYPSSPDRTAPRTWAALGNRVGPRTGSRATAGAPRWWTLRRWARDRAVSPRARLVRVSLTFLLDHAHSHESVGVWVPMRGASNRSLP